MCLPGAQAWHSASGHCQLWWPLPGVLFPDLLDEDVPLQTCPATPACSVFCFSRPGSHPAGPSPCLLQQPGSPEDGGYACWVPARPWHLTRFPDER